MPRLSQHIDGGGLTAGGGAHAPEPPRVALRMRLIGVGVAGAVVIGGSAALVQPWLDVGRHYPWRAAAIFLMIIGIAARFVDEHPFPRLGPANVVTCIRALLIAMVAALIGESPLPGVAVAVIAATAAITVLDGIDGWFARRTQLSSAFGARFDMETDALFAVVLSILVWRQGRAGAWILLGGLFRYVFGAAAWFLPWMARPLSPTRRAKTVAILNMLGLAAALIPMLPAPIGRWAAAATLAVLAWSFMADVNRLRRLEE